MWMNLIRGWFEFEETFFFPRLCLFKCDFNRIPLETVYLFFLSHVFISSLLLYLLLLYWRICVIWLNRFFFLLLLHRYTLTQKMCSMGLKSRCYCCNDFRREQYILISLGSTFSIPLRFKCLDVRFCMVFVRRITKTSENGRLPKLV